MYVLCCYFSFVIIVYYMRTYNLAEEHVEDILSRADFVNFNYILKNLCRLILK